MTSFRNLKQSKNCLKIVWKVGEKSSLGKFKRVPLEKLAFFSSLLQCFLVWVTDTYFSLNILFENFLLSNRGPNSPLRRSIKCRQKVLKTIDPNF